MSDDFDYSFRLRNGGASPPADAALAAYSAPPAAASPPPTMGTSMPEAAFAPPKPFSNWLWEDSGMYRGNPKERFDMRQAQQLYQQYSQNHVRMEIARANYYGRAGRGGAGGLTQYQDLSMRMRMMEAEQRERHQGETTKISEAHLGIAERGELSKMSEAAQIRLKDELNEAQEERSNLRDRWAEVTKALSQPDFSKQGITQKEMWRQELGEIVKELKKKEDVVSRARKKLGYETEIEAAPPATTQPSGRVRVRDKLTGKTGTIDAAALTEQPDRFERLE